MERLILVTTMAASAAFVYGLYLVATAGRRRLLERLERHVLAPWRAEVPGPAAAAIGARARGGRILGRRRREAGPAPVRVARLLEQAGLALRPDEFLPLSLLAAACGSVLLWAALRHPPALVVGLAAGLVPYGLAARARRRREAALERRLPDFLLTLVGALRAGHGLLQALQSVSEGGDGEGPLPAALRRTLAEVQVGTPVEDALERMADRLGNPDVDMVVTAIVIQRRVGGNLGEILETVGQTTRERVRMRMNLRTLTAHGRMSALVVALLPVVVGTLSGLLSPELAHILFRETAGRLVLLSAVLLELVGILALRRVVDIRF